MFIFKSVPGVSVDRAARRSIRRSILFFPEICVSRYRTPGPYSSPSSPSESATIIHAIRFPRAPQPLRTGATRRYHVRPNNSARTFVDVPAGEERRRKKTVSESLRYLPIAVTSAPDCIPKSEALIPLTASRRLSFPSPSVPRTTSISILSLLRRISRPADHSYDRLSPAVFPWPVRNSRSFSNGGTLWRILIRERAKDFANYREVKNLNLSAYRRAPYFSRLSRLFIEIHDKWRRSIFSRDF